MLSLGVRHKAVGVGVLIGETSAGQFGAVGDVEPNQKCSADAEDDDERPIELPAAPVLGP